MFTHNTIYYIFTYVYIFFLFFYLFLVFMKIFQYNIQSLTANNNKQLL